MKVIAFIEHDSMFPNSELPSDAENFSIVLIFVTLWLRSFRVQRRKM